MLSLPGAGLQRLNFSEKIPSTLENLYPSNQSQPSIQTGATFASPNSTSCLIRMYGSEAERWVSSPYIEIYREPSNARERLTGYYDFIHDYFPILPPRVSSSRYQPLHGPMPYSGSPSQEPLMEYRPRSPLSLAISSVLALVTHPSDPEPSSTASTIRSRTYAHTSAQAANSAIETECDLDLSSIDPGQVLSTAQPFVARERFHHRTPVDLESLLALLVLSVYEYSQRGNMIKMRSRAGQALEIALEKSLHVQRGNDEFSEARRRAWWMTVRPPMVLLIARSRSNSSLVLLRDPRIHCSHYGKCSYSHINL